MNSTLQDPRTPAERQRDADRELQRSLRSTSFTLPRRRWPGLLALCILAAGVGGLAVSSLYDKRSTGEKLDATVQNVRDSAHAVARDGALATDRAATALGDTGITAAVKTALAADPKLSAVKIDVSTEDGKVTLTGPAPDERSRERAEVLASAPTGVNHVDNRLVVTPATESTPR